MRIGWDGSLRELEHWASWAATLLAEKPESIEPPSPFGLLARSFTPHAAAVLLEDRRLNQWLRVLFFRDVGRWIAVDETVMPAAQRGFWSTESGEVAWLHAKGAFENHSAGINLKDLVILYKPAVTAFVIDGTRVACTGTAGVALVLSEIFEGREIGAVVADEIVPVFNPPSE
jgi:hypothetical protein